MFVTKSKKLINGKGASLEVEEHLERENIKAFNSPLIFIALTRQMKISTLFLYELCSMSFAVSEKSKNLKIYKSENFMR